LKTFIQQALTAVGLPDADAATVADLMAAADLQGSDGHGVSRLPQYVRRIKAGGFTSGRTSISCTSTPARRS
jgi:L-2-hydroxycarboxylate dehydrogenase (NAD+)